MSDVPERLRRVAQQRQRYEKGESIFSTNANAGLLNEAADEIERLRAEVDSAVITIAKISYCSAQCGADAMEMRNLAMDFMKPIIAKRHAAALSSPDCGTADK